MTLALGGGHLMATGCYSIMLALSVFGIERPELIAAIGFKSSHADDSRFFFIKNCNSSFHFTLIHC